MNNSIGWVQFKLLGGIKNTSITAIAYGAFVLGLMFLATQLTYKPSFHALADGVPLFTGVQFIILLLYGTMRVGHAVRVDVSSSMIESHRLMPVSPISAILGYIFGSTTQALSLFVINIVLGAVCVSSSGVPVKLWIIANGVLLLYSILIWTITAFFSFRFGGAAISLVVIHLILLPASPGPETPAHMVPGLAMLITPMMGRTIFSMGSLDFVESTLLIGSLLQVLICGVYVVAAARRFSRDNVFAFDSALSMLLLLLWVGASLAGATYLNADPRGRIFSYEREESYVLFISGLVSSTAFAILPVSGALRARRLPRILIAIISTGAVSLMLTLAPGGPKHRWDRIAVSVIGIASFLIAMRYLLNLAINRRWWTKPIVALWIFFFWILPSIFDAVIDSQTPYSARYAQPTEGMWNHTVSLPGLLHYCWYFSALFDMSRAWISAGFQIGLAIFAAACFYLLVRSGGKKTSAIDPQPVSVQASADLIAN